MGRRLSLEVNFDPNYCYDESDDGVGRVNGRGCCDDKEKWQISILHTECVSLFCQ